MTDLTPGQLQQAREDAWSELHHAARCVRDAEEELRAARQHLRETLAWGRELGLSPRRMAAELGVSEQWVYRMISQVSGGKDQS